MPILEFLCGSHGSQADPVSGRGSREDIAGSFAAYRCGSRHAGPRVGAPTESEMKSRKEALDDAISATKAAVAEGIVPSGGMAFLRCIHAVA